MTAVLDPVADPVVLDHIPLPELPAVVRGYDGPSPSDVTEFMRMAEFLATARCAIQQEYQRRPGDCGTLMLRAKALDVELGIAMDHIYINGRGKAGLSAQLIAYLLRRAGIDWDTEKTNDHVSMDFYRMVTIQTRTGRTQRRKRKLGKVTFEMHEAITARIADTYHWRTWPIPCMWARCIARASRELFTEIVLGMGYTGEETSSGTADIETAAGTDTAPVSDKVQDFVEQARSEDATPDLIQTDIIPRAKRAKLLGEHAGDGLTLQQTLTRVWTEKVKYRQDQAMAVPADKAMAVAGFTAPPGHPTPSADDAWKSLPVGEGFLPCHCPSSVLLTGDHEMEVCTGVLSG